MDAWEDIKKEATNAYSLAKEKVVQYSDIVSLKVNIKLEEKKRNESFEKLGKLFYENYKKERNLDSNILDTIVDIDNTNEKIDKLKATLATKERTIKCPNCGESIDAESKYCSYCGSSIKKHIDNK